MAQIVSGINQNLLEIWVFYISVLGLKMLAMSVLTAVQRFKNNAFANPEDAVPKKTKVRVDENVERVRRAHLNDLENILVFFLVSFCYILTDPAIGTAKLLFRAVTIARFAHSFVYAVVVIPQPARALSWAVAYFITGFMAVKSILHFAGAM